MPYFLVRWRWLFWKICSNRLWKSFNREYQAQVQVSHKICRFCGQNGWYVKELRYGVKLFDFVGELASNLVFLNLACGLTSYRDMWCAIDGNLLVHRLVNHVLFLEYDCIGLLWVEAPIWVGAWWFCLRKFVGFVCMWSDFKSMAISSTYCTSYSLWFWEVVFEGVEQYPGMNPEVLLIFLGNFMCTCFELRPCAIGHCFQYCVISICLITVLGRCLNA